MSDARGSRTARGRGASARGWIVVALAYVALIFFLSSRPYLHAPGPDFDMKDKIVHALEYAVLGTLLGRAFRGAAGPRSPAVAFLLVLAVGASIAAADEVFQGTVPGRMRDVTDWLADVAGLAMGGGGMVFGARRGRAPAEDSTV